MAKEIDLYEIFPKAKDIQFPMRIPRKKKPKPKPQPKVEDTESLVERYAVESGRTYEDLDEVNSIINKNASSDEEQK